MDILILNILQNILMIFRIPLPKVWENDFDFTNNNFEKDKKNFI
jgi:hypothetical protein